MSRHIRLFQIFLLGGTLALNCLNSFELRAQSSTRVLVCESHSNNDSCNQPDASFDIVWTFDGAQGTATSSANPSGSVVSIEQFDSNKMVVRRTDQAGPTQGLTAVYTGAVHGAHINGAVQWTWPNHSGYPANGTFAAVLQDQVAAAQPASGTSSSSTLPSELLVCENTGGCNAAWILNGSEGTGTWFARNTVKANLTVVRSAPDDILIRRTDTTDNVFAVYAGSLHGDHYSGTIVWSTPGHPGGSTGTWTATVPQTSCGSLPNLEPEDAKRIGQNALMFHRDQEAFDCYKVAAKAGDSTAQVAVGYTYYQGRGSVPQDYTQAFFWLHKAADQGIYAAQRTVAEMYEAGQGTSRDQSLAHIYNARADEQKHDQERRQDLQERAADRQAQILSSFVLGASFGIFMY